jgi:hypothetical protein
MFVVNAILFPLAIALLAVGLFVWHLRSWRGEQQEQGQEREFAYRRFRRRMQTTSMLAALGIGLCLGQLIPREEHPTLFVIFWFGMLLLLAWMVLLALGDLIIGRQQLARLARERRIAEAQLNAELERLRREGAKH